MRNERELIIECFPSILSKTSYQFADLAPGDDESDPSEAGLQSIVEFRCGKLSGAIGVQVSELFALQLVANMIGADPDGVIDPVVMRDSTGELVNIFAGQLLPVIFGKSELFTLLAPVVTPLQSDKWSENRSQYTTVAFQVDDEFPVFVMYRSGGNRHAS
ncbi:MAG: chemotaxis protein CheX [bacterium]|nr:chemotaxis protein CheX [bacterium]